MDIVNLALQIATKAHANQLDKGGAQYIEHPKFVASLLTSPEEKATVLLREHCGGEVLCGLLLLLLININ